MENAKPRLIVPSGVEAGAALRGNLNDAGQVRGATPKPAKVKNWTVAEAREALGLPARPTAWVTSDVGDPDVFAENERRKILTVLGDLSGIADLIWNRVLIAVWRAPEAKETAGGKIFRSDANRDNDGWQGSTGLIVRMGPTAFVSGFNEETREPIYQLQAPKVGDWVGFSRGYGTTVKINDIPLVLIDKETEAIKMVLRYPHAVDIT